MRRLLNKGHAVQLSFFLLDQTSSGAVENKELIPRVPEDTPASETDINLEVSFAEQAVNEKELSKERMPKTRGNDASLPVCNTHSDDPKRMLFERPLYF